MLAPGVVPVRDPPCAAVPLLITAMGDGPWLSVTHTQLRTSGPGRQRPRWEMRLCPRCTVSVCPSGYTEGGAPLNSTGLTPARQRPSPHTAAAPFSRRKLGSGACTQVLRGTHFTKKQECACRC